MSSGDKAMVDTYSIQASEAKTIGSSVLEISVADEKEIKTNVPAAETLMSIGSDDQVTGKEDGEEVQSEEVQSRPEVVNPRGYQREMLEQSLKRNVIVAMDTGSGKTQVAVMRIQHELETRAPDKIVWFLGKTVSLCEQQYSVLQRQMPSVSMRLLTGQLNIDAWSEERWPRILHGTRIIVSTFDILRDALDHAFVKMNMLSLIVFDEVHNCVKNSSGRKIMVNFYREHKKAGMPVPAILGLTASPVQSKSRRDETLELEITMDAICVTPTVNRKELLQHVNKPNLSRVLYDVEEHPTRTPLMQTLQSEYSRMDIAHDPSIAKIRESIDKSDNTGSEILSLLMKHGTFSQKQLKSLWNKSKDILAELGPWAADKYISELVNLFLERVDSPTTYSDGWNNEDRTYLAGHLRQVAASPHQPKLPAGHNLADKTNKLIQELLTADEDVVGIIFVRSRATANVLCALLKEHPEIRNRYRVGSIVGSATSKIQKQNIYEYPYSSSTEVLQDFRSGAINLLVSTSVLEEGIDVAACNLVVCFDEIATLKSYIQRRGRARKRKSRMIVLARSTSDMREWDSLESEMKSRYGREREELDRLEIEARTEATSSISYTVPNSGARLDLGNSRQHLEHFCNKVFQRDYVDQRPVYVFHKTELGTAPPTFSATVTLPSALPRHLRRCQGGGGWRSEKNAMKEAAFRAFVALYQEGLVSDHLLPLNADSKEEEEEETQLTEPELLFNPWQDVVQKWQTAADKWLYAYEFFDHEYVTPLRFEIALPVDLPRPRDITAHPEVGITWHVKCTSVRKISNKECSGLPDHTSTLLAMHFGHRWNVEDRDHVIKLIYETKGLSRDRIGSVPFSESIDAILEKRVLVRDPRKTPFHYVKTIPSKPPREQVQHPFNEYEDAPEETYLVVEQWTRRSDVLHELRPGQSGSSCTKPYRWVLPISRATVDEIPRRAVKCAMLIPCIIHELEVQLIASELSSTLLAPVGIADLQLVIEAISSRSAAEPVDYERLEFLGDSVLKFCTVTQVYSEHPFWPEGLLNHFKDRLVSNTRLARMCLETGLSKFILAKTFTGVKWRPLYRDDFLDVKPVDGTSRFIGPKTLADVVEALVGASYQDGGMHKSLKCIKVFLGSKCNWHDDGVARDILFRAAPSDMQLPPAMEPLEELIGYTFKKKSLLVEAMTHGSYVADGQQRSYEQLEFLGDAVLDYIIVTRMFRFDPPVSNGRLHMIKTAMANAEFLAFTNMQHGLRRPEIEFKDGEPVSTEVSLPIWKFMRHGSPEMGRVMNETQARFESLRDEINAARTNGTHYPWTLLARLHPKKFYSDLFEAILGAIWVDSGNIETCAAFLHKFGILPYLDRILREDVHVQHPKEELGKLAVDQKIVYDYTPVDGPIKEYLCTVNVGDRVVGVVSGALNKLEAMTKAAEEGVNLLNAEQRRAEQAAQDEAARPLVAMDLS